MRARSLRSLIQSTVSPLAMNLKPSERIVCVDVETTGLSPQSTVLEIGLRLIDLQLNELSRFTALILPAGNTWQNEMDDYVLSMHLGNGLIRDLSDGWGISLQSVRLLMKEWCVSNGLQGADPICGSSVKMDYDWILNSIFNCDEKEMKKFFHYRVMDISSLKELVRRFWGEEHVYDNSQIEKVHRTQADIDATIEELQHYLSLLGPSAVRES